MVVLVLVLAVVVRGGGGEGQILVLKDNLALFCILEESREQRHTQKKLFDCSLIHENGITGLRTFRQLQVTMRGGCSSARTSKLVVI